MEPNGQDALKAGDFWVSRLTSHVVSSADPSATNHTFQDLHFPLKMPHRSGPGLMKLYTPPKKINETVVDFGGWARPWAPSMHLLTKKPATFYNREGPVPAVHVPGSKFLLPF